MSLRNLDIQIIGFFRRISTPVGRFAIFIIFFWFGFLKVVGLSPAGPLVEALFTQTLGAMLPSLTFGTFYMGRLTTKDGKFKMIMASTTAMIGLGVTIHFLP